MDINMTINAEMKLWYFSISKEEILDAMMKGEQRVDEKGITHFSYGEVIIIASVKDNEADVITIRYSRKMERKARKKAKENGVCLRNAFKSLKGQDRIHYQEVLHQNM